MLKTSLKQWDNVTRSEVHDYHRCYGDARNVHRFRTGKPYDCLRPPWAAASCMDKVQGHVDMLVDMLVAHHFVWLQPDQRALNVCDLRSLETFHLQADTREKIKNAALSEELVAFTTISNTCYVIDLARGRKAMKKFKLSPGMFQQLVCHGRLVFCAGFVSTQSQLMIYMWDFDAQSGSSFHVSFRGDHM